MLRRLAVIATVALVALVSSPALAQELTDPLQPLIAFLSARADADLETELVREPTGGAVVTDPANDFEHITGEPPRFTPNYIDIRLATLSVLEPGPVALFEPTNDSQVFGPTGSREIDPPGYPALFTYTTTLPKDGAQYQDGALLFQIGLQEPPPAEPEGGCDFTVWVHDSSRDGEFQNLAEFPLDPATGSNRAFGLRLAPAGGGISRAFAFALDDSGAFGPTDTDVRAFLFGETVGVMVPREAVGVLAAVNYHAVCSVEGSNFEPSTSGADQTGAVTAVLAEAGVVAIMETPVTATPTATVAPTTTSRPTTTVPNEVVAEAGPGVPPWAPAAAAIVLLGTAGFWAWVRRRNPEERALAAWRKAEAALAATEDQAEPLLIACLETRAILEELEHERADLCRVWPPVCLEEEEGDVAGLSSRDQHFRRMALGELGADYKEGKIGAEEVEARWREVNTPEFRTRMRESDEAYADTLRQLDDEIAGARASVDTTCAAGDSAAARLETAHEAVASTRSAYLEVLESSPAEQAPAASWLIDACEDRDAPRVAAEGPVELLRINVGFMLTIGRFAGRERNLERGERLVLELEGLLHELELSRAMHGIRDGGLHTGWTGHEFEPGVYWVTGDGIRRGAPDEPRVPEAETVQPATPAVPPGPILTQLPGSIGDYAYSRVAGWTTGFETLTMQRTSFHQLIISRPFAVWHCHDGRWARQERVWRVEVGEPLRNRGEVRWFSVDSPGRRAQFETEVNRLAWVATGVVTRDLRRLLRWREKHASEPTT